MVRRLAYLGTLGLLLFSPLLYAASAQWEPSLQPNSLAPTATPTQPRTLSVERAIRIVRQETGGRVLAAAPGQQQGRSGVRVRILVDGERVSTVFVDVDGNIQRR